MIILFLLLVSGQICYSTCSSGNDWKCLEMYAIEILLYKSMKSTLDQ